MNAFPNVHDPKTGSMSHGMSLRDYFAAKAMQGISSIPLPAEATMHNVSPAYWISENAYAIADAMMKVRDLWLLKTSLYM